jgi:hypothetical protein
LIGLEARASSIGGTGHIPRQTWAARETAEMAAEQKLTASTLIDEIYDDLAREPKRRKKDNIKKKKEKERKGKREKGKGKRGRGRGEEDEGERRKEKRREKGEEGKWVAGKYENENRGKKKC